MPTPNKSNTSRAESGVSDRSVWSGDHTKAIIRSVILSTRATTKNLLEKISGGEADLIIGTHALLYKGVVFNKLGFVTIDEQHRFGVEQRAEIMNKGANPDILIMSATPIPRSLGLSLYGDLDISEPQLNYPATQVKFGQGTGRIALGIEQGGDHRDDLGAEAGTGDLETDFTHLQGVG